MNAIRIHDFGGAEKLRLEDIEKPKPKADEVLIKNAAAGINYADIMLRKGEYLRQPHLPVIPGFEAAGTVEAVGANVTDWKVGQRVVALVDEGGYAEYVATKGSQLVSIPDGLEFGHATALLVQGLTAVALLMEHINAGRLRVMVTAFPIEQAMDAHRAIESRRTTGKIVLSMN
jgi:NADPH2:quinone reductase